MEERCAQKEGAREESQPTLDFVANLDILRSSAVILVLLDHVLEVAHAKYGLFKFDTQCAGRLGVLLFFVHTSLVLNFSLARLGSSGWTLIRTFLVRRAFRLYPLSIVCVLLVAAFKVPFAPLEGVMPVHSWGLLLSNLALTTDLTSSPTLLGPLWTLPVEAQMYVVMPLIFILLGRKRSPRVALGLWLLAAAIAWTQPYISKFLTSIDFAPCFVAGIVAYALSGRYVRRLPGFLWIPFLLAILYGFFIYQQAVPEGWGNMPLEWVFCLILGLAIPLFRDSTAIRVNFVARRTAQYSYGIYLFHDIALWVGCVVLRDLPEPLQWVAVLVVLTTMSIGGYHLLEKPTIDLGARLTGAKSSATLDATAVTEREGSGAH